MGKAKQDADKQGVNTGCDQRVAILAQVCVTFGSSLRRFVFKIREYRAAGLRPLMRVYCGWADSQSEESQCVTAFFGTFDAACALWL